MPYATQNHDLERWVLHTGSREQVVREIDVGVFEALDEEAALGMGLKVQKLDYRLCRRHSKHPEEQGDATLRNGLKTSVVS